MIAAETTWQVSAVVVGSIAAGGISLIIAIVLAFVDHEAKKNVRKAVTTVGDNATKAVADPDPAQNPVKAQATVNYEGLAKLAEAIEKLNQSGRFLIASLAFFASAAIAAGAGAIADAAGS